MKAGTLIACVGPAPSISASLPDLAGLTDAVLQHAQTVDPELDAASLREWTAAGRATEVLEQLHHRLGDDFQREVERLLSDQGRALPPEAAALAKLRKQLRGIYALRLTRGRPTPWHFTAARFRACEIGPSRSIDRAARVTQDT